MDAVKKPRRRYHSPARIALEADISRGMVYKLIREGVLKGVRLRGMVRVTDESYKAFLKSARDVA